MAHRGVVGMLEGLADNSVLEQVAPQRVSGNLLDGADPDEVAREPDVDEIEFR